MDNFNITFTYPWLLLLLIPAVILTLIPYFRLSKKYRRTRNRITSIVLHLVVMTLAIFTLAGMNFNYTIPNEKNEIIYLVDVSESENVSAEARDEMLESLVYDSKFDGFNVGIVTFGYDQIYAAKLTTDVEKAYEDYLSAPLPDTSATNIAAALRYTKGLFKNPQTGKIVLVTDAKETDEEADGEIRSILFQGIKLDAVYVPSSYTEVDAMVTGITLPEYNVQPKEDCIINVSFYTNVEGAVSVVLSDNGTPVSGLQGFGVFPAGENFIGITHKFMEEGLHEITAEISIANLDAMEVNNTYTTYINLEKTNNVLIIEREDESQELIAMLNEGSTEEDPNYKITVARIGSEIVPTTVDQLRAYDQVILNNISNEDLQVHTDLDVMLEEYVNLHGGSLFTVGGNEEEGNAVAYNRTDMYGTVYQQMLPVQVVNYTPPVGVIMIIDTSGSMSEGDSHGDSYLEAAKAGALSCLDAMSDRDYLGLMTLDSTYNMLIKPTPMSQRRLIENAIDSLVDPSGGTMFTPSLAKAGEELQLIKSMVAKLHIIMITDGKPGDPVEEIHPIVKENYDTKGITVSIVGIGVVPNSEEAIAMQEIVDAVGEVDPSKKGRLHMPTTAGELIETIRDDLSAPAITEVVDEEFKPVIANTMSPLVYELDRAEGTESNKLNVSLNGFFGVKARANADVVLEAPYGVPLYAQWQYGNGRVGSFMCDLQGSSWSKSFMDNETGKTFIKRAMNQLMPTSNIRPAEINVKLIEDNYTNALSVYSTVEKGESITGTITKVGSDKSVSMNSVTPLTGDETVYVTEALSEGNQYSRCYFTIKESGIYEIVLEKRNSEGKVVASYKMHKAFSYSEEFLFSDQKADLEAKEALSGWIDKSEGELIESVDDAWMIFEGFVTDIAQNFDPRFLYMILAIVLFLMDIAVRKFKFKWPHEIIRDRKNMKGKNK